MLLLQVARAVFEREYRKMTGTSSCDSGHGAASFAGSILSWGSQTRRARPMRAGGDAT